MSCRPLVLRADVSVLRQIDILPATDINRTVGVSWSSKLATLCSCIAVALAALSAMSLSKAARIVLATAPLVAWD